jgi:hypothetical protein
MTYIRVVQGRKISPSSGQIKVEKVVAILSLPAGISQ